VEKKRRKWKRREENIREVSGRECKRRKWKRREKK